MKRLCAILSALAFAVLLPAAGLAQNLTADLEGFSGGAADATGYAVLAVNGTMIDTTVLTQGLDNPTAAHVNRASDDSMVIDQQHPNLLHAFPLSFPVAGSDGPFYHGARGNVKNTACGWHQQRLRS